MYLIDVKTCRDNALNVDANIHANATVYFNVDMCAASLFDPFKIKHVFRGVGCKKGVFWDQTVRIAKTRGLP